LSPNRGGTQSALTNKPRNTLGSSDMMRSSVETSNTQYDMGATTNLGGRTDLQMRNTMSTIPENKYTNNYMSNQQPMVEQE